LVEFSDNTSTLIPTAVKPNSGNNNTQKQTTLITSLQHDTCESKRAELHQNHFQLQLRLQSLILMPGEVTRTVRALAATFRKAVLLNKSPLHPFASPDSMKAFETVVIILDCTSRSFSGWKWIAVMVDVDEKMAMIRKINMCVLREAMGLELFGVLLRDTNKIPDVRELMEVLSS
jgi:hypothetical protein